MKKRNEFRKRKLSFLLIFLLFVAMISINVGSAIFYNVITQFFSVVKVDKVKTNATSATAQNVVEEIEAEGAVLLQNNGALPLTMENENEKKVNVFGWASVSPVFGGGVGSASSYEGNSISLYDGLKNAGFLPNEELYSFYNDSGLKEKSTNRFGEFVLDYTIYGVDSKDYPQSLLNSAKNYSEVALIVLARNGGEGGDVPLEMSEWGGDKSRHYLELSSQEEETIDMVVSLGFKKVVVVINSIHSLELGFLEEKKIDAGLWIGGPGQTGMNSVANILKGDVNPSGRLTDTYAYDFESAPSFENTGEFSYSGTEYEAYDVWTDSNYDTSHQYLDYAEGIYIGYRYYETRYLDKETKKIDEDLYTAAVQYPFGYGLSYTTFQKNISEFSYDDKTINMSVNVTNTGGSPGKEVVQVYYNPPYNSGGIEKSHVVLAGFNKTNVLAPGESQTIDLTINVEDMASFDYKKLGSYVLEKGLYNIVLMDNAHDVIDSRKYELTESIVYSGDNKRDSDSVPAINRFEDVQGDISFVSRDDWEGTLPTNVPKEREGTPDILDAMTNYQPEKSTEVDDITIKDNGLTLKDMIGLSYEDPKWELLLEQLSIKDMQNLIGFGGYSTQKINSIKKPYSVDLDGPTGINALVNLSDAAYNTN